jgi:hypothetical protein
MIMDLNLFHLMKGMQTFADGLVIGNRRRVRMLIFVPLDHTQIGKWFSIYDTVIDNYVALRGNQSWETFDDYKYDADDEAKRAWGAARGDQLKRLLAKEKVIRDWESEEETISAYQRGYLDGIQRKLKSSD